MKPLKPGYDSNTAQAEVVKAVCEYFGRVFDDREAERHAALRGHRPDDDYWYDVMGEEPTLNETARKFGITPAKVRKILITGGQFDTSLFRRINKLVGEGKTVDEISNELGMKPVTVRSYLPYERVIYKMEERSVNADRLMRFKARHGGYKAKEP